MSGLGVDDVRRIVREELAKHIPPAVMKANERAENTYPFRGPLMPDEWAGAVIRNADYEKFRIDQAAAAAHRSAGADHGHRNSGAEPQAVNLSGDDNLKPGGSPLGSDLVGHGEQIIGVAVADFVRDPVVDDSGHFASPSGDSVASDSSPVAGSPAKNPPATGGLSQQESEEA